MTTKFFSKIIFSAFLFVIGIVFFSFSQVDFKQYKERSEKTVISKIPKKTSRVPTYFFRPLIGLKKHQVKISVLPGVYDTAVSLKFDLPSNIELYYIINNNTTSSTIKYSAPIDINSPVNFRFWLSKDGKMMDTIFCGTFIIDVKHTLPILSLTVNPASFFPPSGIYYGFSKIESDSSLTFWGNCWKEEEIDCHAEFFFQNKLVEKGPFGLKTSGGMTLGYSEKSLQLVAKKEYGEKSIDYKLFSTKPWNKFKSIKIRTSGNDQAGTRFKDMMLSSVARDLQVDYMAYQPVVLYINGIYWGIHNLREKINENYLKYNHDADPDSTTLVQGYGMTNPEYRKLVDYLVSQNQSKDFPAKLETMMDVDNYLNFVILQLFISNVDSRGNIRFWKAKNIDNRYRWIFYDADLSSGNNFINRNFLKDRLSPIETDWYNPPYATVVLRSLTANPELRNRFINQYCLLLSTFFRKDSMINRIDYFKSLIEKEIPNHVLRRNNIHKESVNSWNSKVDNLKYYFEHFPAKAIVQLKDVFNLGDTNMIHFSTNMPWLKTLKINNSKLRFQRVSGIFFQEVPLKIQATSDNHLYKFVKWLEDNSTNSERTITIDSVSEYTAVYEHKKKSKIANNLEISRFYSSMQTKKNLEWIEIKNKSDRSIQIENFVLFDDCSQWRFVFSNQNISPTSSIIISCDTAEWLKVNKNFKGVLIQKKINYIFKQQHRFVLCDQFNNWIDSMYVDFPDSILLKKNHFMAFKILGNVKCVFWSPENQTEDWGIKPAQNKKQSYEYDSDFYFYFYWGLGFVSMIVLFSGLLILRRIVKRKIKKRVL